jgi:hypothetical protein
MYGKIKDDICVCCGEYVPEGRQVCLSCEKNEGPFRAVSETLMVEYDSSTGTDISALSVVRFSGTRREVVNTFIGEEADWMYDRLINDKTGRVKKFKKGDI